MKVVREYGAKDAGKPARNRNPAYALPTPRTSENSRSYNASLPTSASRKLLDRSNVVQAGTLLKDLVQ